MLKSTDLSHRVPRPAASSSALWRHVDSTSAKAGSTERLWRGDVRYRSIRPYSVSSFGAPSYAKLQLATITSVSSPLKVPAFFLEGCAPARGGRASFASLRTSWPPPPPHTGPAVAARAGPEEHRPFRQRLVHDPNRRSQHCPQRHHQVLARYRRCRNRPMTPVAGGRLPRKPMISAPSCSRVAGVSSVARPG